VTYLVDADVLIRAKNQHYGFDFFPGFWDWLDEANTDGLVCSVEQVGRELMNYNDQLAAWARARIGSFFVPPDDDVVQSLRAIATWVAGTGPRYTQAAVAEFLASADYYLIAHGHANQDVVVTHEITSPSAKKIKIPDACSAMGVQCVTVFEMLRACGVRFVLAH
jgi:hypothetical protein